jgi:prepilin-type N-terminal cleavage/methylation domain-containing protein
LSVRVHRKGSHESGFTLIEVLVSLVLAAITMIGVMALYRAQSNASSFSRRSTEATALAEDQLERLRLSTGTGTGSNIFDEAGKVTAGAVIAPFDPGTFHRQFAVTQSPAGEFNITVIVTWTDEGLKKSVQLTGKRNAP